MAGPDRSPHILVNLPEGFFAADFLTPVWDRLRAQGTVTMTSANTLEEIAPLLQKSDAVIMWSWPVLSEELLATCPALRFAGHINVSGIGAKAELAHGLAVSEARHGWSPAVAEMALALLLSGLRRLGSYHQAFPQGTESWVERIPADIDPRERELTGMSVGVVGFGRIGQRLAELLRPFAVELRTYDPYLPAAVAKAQGAQLTSLDDLLTSSEAIVLCAANTPSAEHLLGAAEIAKLQPEALLVNVARASLVDTNALQERLRQGDLTYMVDVYEREPLPADDAWRALPNCFGTPHRAGAMQSSVRRCLEMLVDDYERFRREEPRRWVIDAKAAAGLPDKG